MDQQVVDELAVSLFQKVAPRDVLREPVHVSFSAADVISEGEKHNWQFRQMDYRGTIDEPFADDEFEYFDLATVEDDYTLPGWADKRLRLVQSKFPVKQVIIAHEKENALDEAEAMALRQVERGRSGARKVAEGVGTATGAVVTATTKLLLFVASGIALAAGALAVAGAALAALVVGAAVLAIGALVAVPAAVLADPLVIVVLDNEEESWVCIARYLE